MVFGLFNGKHGKSRQRSECGSYYDDDDDGTSYYDDASTTFSEKSGSTITTLSHHNSVRRARSTASITRSGSDETEATRNTTRLDRSIDVEEDSYPEVDYDKECTELFHLIQDKNWDGAAECAKANPEQIKTWVFRKEPENPTKLRWRLLPIHAMCVFLSPESLMDLLLDNFPKAASMRDDQGMLPIHLACRNGSSKGVVKALLEAYPEGLKAIDRKKRTPLDLAKAYSNFNKEGIILTLERFSQNLKPVVIQSNEPAKTNIGKAVAGLKENEVDYEHRTTLLRQIVKRDWKSVVLRAQRYPKEVGTWTVTRGVSGDVRFLPIHKACVLKPPSYVIEALVKAFPEGPSAKDQDGWLAIHCAAFYSASDAVITVLLNANPSGSKLKDEEGRLALHYACMKGLPLEVVEALLRSYPKSAQLKDDEGHTPLHMACANIAPLQVVQALIEISPKCAQQRDDQGRIPLHHVCSNGELDVNDVKSMVQLLLQVFPVGASIRDDSGKLPLHYACENGNVAQGAIPLLISAYPQGAHEKDGFGYTPFNTAKALEKEGVTNVLESLMSPNAVVNTASKPESTWTNSAGNKENDEVLATRLSQLETTFYGFGQAMHDIQSKLHSGEDPKIILDKLTNDMSASGLTLKNP